MEIIHVDYAVIGSGPAGQKAAIQAAKLEKSVVIIEKNISIGGNSLNSGTIPSKALREAILDLSRYNDRGFYGSYCSHDVAIGDLTDRLQIVLSSERELLLRQFKKNKIRVVHGQARFIYPHQLVVTEKNAEDIEIHASYILIASGSEPRNPMHIPFDEDVILDSTRLLSFKKIPKTLVVLGGGVIGSEYASFFATLGSKVTVLDKRNRLLSGLDEEIGTHLQGGLQDIGLVFCPSKIPKKVERKNNRAIVTCEDDTYFEADALLYALGREANVKDIGLEKANLEVNERGYLPVNENFQTKQSHIYAAGDVIGYPALASTSMEQGRLAALHAFTKRTILFPKVFPLGIYTIPEISTVGYTEEELLKKGADYEVGRAYYYEIARSHISGSAKFGMFKILFDKKTLEILGVHIIGRGATELIHIGQIGMTLKVKLDFFVEQVFNYPTFAEGYRIAALNGLNKLKNKYN